MQVLPGPGQQPGRRVGEVLAPREQVLLQNVGAPVDEGLLGEEALPVEAVAPDEGGADLGDVFEFQLEEEVGDSLYFAGGVVEVLDFFDEGVVGAQNVVRDRDRAVSA